MSHAPTPRSSSPTIAASRGVAGHGVEVAGDQDARRVVSRRARHDVVARRARRPDGAAPRSRDSTKAASAASWRLTELMATSAKASSSRLT